MPNNKHGDDLKGERKDIAGETESSNDDEHDLSGEAAGVVRGVSRSILRAPLIGRLPARATKGSTYGRSLLRRRVPARQIARVSDRVATGLDLYTSAVEADVDVSKRSRAWLTGARSFAWNLFRNTLLGMAVFESYGYVVSALAPPTAGASVTVQSTESDASTSMDENDEDNSIHFGVKDEYSLAELKVHFIAGAAAGTVHGLASAATERNIVPRFSMARYTYFSTLHHSLAHSILFGSYEACKRMILTLTKDEERNGSRAYHLLSFGVAGGVAGQLQHLTTHYAEIVLGLSELTLKIDWRASSLWTAPSLRPVLWAFPPSAIGFIAFEYGKQFTS